MPDLPQNITRNDILSAIGRIDEEDIPSGAHSSTYDLIHDGNRYPPKLVVSWANAFANEVELDRSSFPGGKDTACFRLLERQGFSIENKDDTQALYKLWDEFLEAWPISKIENMTLEEYSSVGNKESFCYWLEAKLEGLGSIWGGSSFKFGIYNRSDRSEKAESNRYTYSSDYAWESKHGGTEQEAFETMRTNILLVISCVQSNSIEDIESITLWPVFKWKIAFLYQDRDKPLLPGVFKSELLAAYINVDEFSVKTPMNKLYHEVMIGREGRDILAYSKDIWSVAGKRLLDKMFLPDEAEVILKQRYQSIAGGNKKVIGFINSANKTIALAREGKSVRLTMEPWEPSKKLCKVTARYKADATRNDNFPKQAPNVATGKEAIVIECTHRDAFETLLDEYEEIESPVTDEFVPTREPKMPLNEQPLNQILYGPPGTGKTYYTVNKALEILDPEFYEANAGDRSALHARFKVLKAENRIGFVTFHQSFSYEDFVEGLKASSEDGKITYDVADGIFKEMCETDQPGVEKASAINVDVTGRKVWKMSLGNTLGSDSYIFDNCIEANQIRLGYGEDIDFSACENRSKIVEQFTEHHETFDKNDFSVTAVDNFKNQMRVGDLVVVTDGNLKFRAIAEISSDYRCLPDSDFGHYAQTREVIWHRVYEKSLPYERIMDNKFSQMTIYKLRPKAINMERFQTILSGIEGEFRQGGLKVGQTLGNSGHQIVSLSDELIRIKSLKTDSVISFDRQMINELVENVRSESLTVDDIARKRVFEKTDSTLEKFIVNGYPGPISKIVDVLLSSKGAKNVAKDTDNKNRVLIIDEINRGNISSIFGELITLIEPSKRAGADEALSVTLPYSKELFQVPKNLHLIGTMNTADRSLALMDTALRRRFDFVEMMPNVGELEEVDVKGIKIAEMLMIMNKRIEVLYDREHTLGHAFFIPLKFEKDEEKQFEMLASIFSNKILPLLEEYFFEDWAKIRLVLGDGNKEDSYQFITVNGDDYDIEKLFGKNTEPGYEVEEAKSYRRNDSALNELASYIGIYES